MDKEAVRQCLQEATAELAIVEEKRSALIALLRGYEAWLRVHDPPPSRRRQAARAPTPQEAPPG